MTTIRDVAKKAQVSVSTVSRVLNHQNLVIPEKRERVLKAIEELGFQPNGLARSLIHRRTQTIGVLVPDLSVFPFMEAIRGMEDTAHAHGWHLIISSFTEGEGRTVNLLKVLGERRVDGIVFAKKDVSDELEQLLERLSIPVVLIGSSHRRLTSIYIDREQASFDAVCYLIAQGHRKIGIISGPLEDKTGAVPKIEGYRKALKMHGIAYHPEWVYSGPEYGFEAAKQGAEILLKQVPGMTAIYAASDEMALGIYSYAFEQGIRIPEDLSVMGFDNVKIARMFSPPLTTVAQPLYEMGEKAVTCLVDHIRGVAGEPVVHCLQHRVVVRSSVAQPNTCQA